MTVTPASSATLPDEVSITYHDPARDYQAGLQRARRGGPARRADRNALDVLLLHDEMALSGEARPYQSATGGLALMGEELVQFTGAERIAPATWRLTGLWRGRRGTEWASAGHGAGERFVLIEPGALVAWDVPAAAIGATARVAARGVGDDLPFEAGAIIAANALAPPAPVRLTARRLADGAVECGWTRRSRAGFAWLDGGDAPVGQSAEHYRVRIVATGGAGRTIESDVAAITYTAAMHAADGVAISAALTLFVAQAGELGGWSREAGISLS